MAFREDDGTLISRRDISDLVGVRIAKIEDDGAESWLVYAYDGSAGDQVLVAMIRRDGLFDADADYFADPA
jgi:hypothetical protein